MHAVDQPIEYERAVIALMRDMPEIARAQVYYFARFIKDRLDTTERALLGEPISAESALMLASIDSLRKVWDTPEEDAAWAYLQKATS